MPIPIEHTPVTTGDFRAVFKVLAGVDGHQRDVDDAKTWMIAARAGRWSRAQVAAATLELSARFTGYRVQPGHMTEQINRNREKIRTHWYCPDPPRSLADDPAGELAWRRWAADDFADRALFALANGDPIDEVPMTVTDDPPRRVIEDGKRRLQERVNEVARASSLPADVQQERGVWAPRRQRDPQVAEDARREIANTPPAEIPAQQDQGSEDRTEELA